MSLNLEPGGYRQTTTTFFSSSSLPNLAAAALPATARSHMTTPSYPRPDFVRTNLTWASLNGPWSFLFDDTDAGLTASWHKTGLPSTSTSSLPPQDGPAAATPHHDDTTTSSSQHHHARRTIQVPFVFQSQASGIHCTSAHNVLWYERRIRDPRTAAQRRAGHRALLRFGAVDYHATVWVDGRLAGAHRGGHVPFDLDVSEQMDAAADDDAAADAANDEHHRVTLRVFDSATDLTQPRGKQFWGPLPDTGIFYTPSSGIWQSVWAESVPGAHIADASAGTVLRADDITAGVLRARVVVLGRRVGAAYSVDVGAAFAGVKVAMGRGKLAEDGDGVDVEVVMRLSAEQQEECARDVLEGAPLSDDTCWRDGVALWSPEHPLLYDVTIRLLDGAGAVVDEITTTTGMRSLDWLSGSGAILLNGRPYFQALVLDQGYWPATLMTPPTPDALRADIELAKRMGFSGCRKHQKVEDPVFLHWADRLGYLVWGEMANAYAFSREYVERFDAEWREAVARDVNHPCVVAWTPGNESWGYLGLADNVEQRNHIRSLYYTTK